MITDDQIGFAPVDSRDHVAINGADVDWLPEFELVKAYNSLAEREFRQQLDDSEQAVFDAINRHLETRTSFVYDRSRHLLLLDRRWLSLYPADVQSDIVRLGWVF